MASFSSAIYNTLFKRNSVYVTSIFAGAFVFGIAFDAGTQRLWDAHNRGKQWKDIRDKVAPSDGE
ncbi:putative ubiquinol-cytochrome c reductase complex 7.3 kda protein [Ceraceosorus guamensis]|uniref:Complex III subunit 9 n=1 Tax=Ceraceosorus guamensis TaxID=1522189 RepID=A0A316W8A9_9BASI|nr:putative ubiquinol-cytochrome c reductase complex 7.3 kda protein [Ceraceosorus guamensis]PWN44283.1 putative ubiquinol-cytochrome c reductase complex 7.3 kda protein [Ceraceosorus guamensis]